MTVVGSLCGGMAVLLDPMATGACCGSRFNLGHGENGERRVEKAGRWKNDSNQHVCCSWYWISGGYLCGKATGASVVMRWGKLRAQSFYGTGD